MAHIRGYKYRRRGKLIKVPGHSRRTYKGYSSRRAFLADHKKKARHRPAKRYKRHLGHRGDW